MTSFLGGVIIMIGPDIFLVRVIIIIHHDINYIITITHAPKQMSGPIIIMTPPNNERPLHLFGWCHSNGRP